MTQFFFAFFLEEDGRGETACSSTLLTITHACIYWTYDMYLSLNGLKSALWLVMVYFGTWMHTVDCECTWMIYSASWMLGTLSFALLCCTWSTSDGDEPGWSECCCRDVWLGGHGNILQSDDSLIVLIRYSLSNLFMIQVTWPPPQTNERVGGYEFLGGEAEAKQIDKINDFWYLLLIQVFSISCLQDLGSIFAIICCFDLFCSLFYHFFLYFVTLSVFGFSRCFHDSARLQNMKLQLSIMKWASVTFSETFSIVSRHSRKAILLICRGFGKFEFAMKDSSSITKSLKRVRIRWRKKIIWCNCIISKHP